MSTNRPSEPQFPIAPAQAKLLEIEKQFEVLQQNISQLKVMLNPTPRTPTPPFNEEQGTGQRKPEVIKGRR